MTGGGGGGGGSGASLNDASLANLLAPVIYTLRTDGVVQYDDDGANADYTYSATPTDFEVRATLISGNTPGGTFGTWMSLGSVARAWSYSASGSSKSCLMTIEIRRASDFSLVTSATISMSYDNGA